MPHRSVRLAASALLFASLVPARGVEVEFDPTRADAGPFPTDFLTIPDARQKTGLRVNLPLPDCATRASDCQEIGVINQLDGFNVLPRLTVKFSGAVDPGTLAAGIHYVWLDQIDPSEYGLGPVGKISPINQVVWDPATNTAYAKPDDFFDQSRRYAIVVTDAVRDRAGDPVESTPGFQLCLDRLLGGDYCVRLSAAVESIRARVPGRIVGASIFTTLSATSFMEKARAALQTSPVSFRRTGTTSVFSLANVQAVNLQIDLGSNIRTTALPLPIPLLIAGGVGRVSFASIRSPRFLNAAGLIPQVPTAESVPLPEQTEELFFHVFLPATPAPASGYPVLLAGHGLNDSRFGLPLALAAGMSNRGFAIVAMNAFGHGWGPRTSVEITETSGNVITVPAPGRGVDLDRNGNIDSTEGCIVFAGAPVFLRDCLRQTALDYMQVVRAIRMGMDLDGDGRPDLDPNRISYVGQSLGSFYGAILNAVEPDIPAAVLNVGGGSVIDAARLSPVFQPLMGAYLLTRQPIVLNPGTGLNPEIPLRYEPVRTLSLPASAGMQEILERLHWIEAPGAPQNFATHLAPATLAGVPIKRILFQMALGDRTVPNPTNTALVRAANMGANTALYRHDLARAAAADLPADPHGFYLAGIGPPQALAIGLAAQQQAALFLLSGTDAVPDVNALLVLVFGRPVFEVPAALPERLNF